MKQTIIPKDKEEWLALRTKDITSTEVACLFNLSPYSTAYELWHRKKDQSIVQINESERMKWGSRLESAIANGIAQDNNWVVEPMKCYMRDDELRIGSSFDFAIGTDGILEIKNVDSLAFRDGWTVDDTGNIEAPPHIELQVQHQLAVSGRSYAYIGALVGGNYVALIKREPDEKIIKSIKSKVKEFWESIDRNIQPTPNFERDAAFIKSLYQYAEPDKTIDAGTEIENLAVTYRDLSRQIKDMDAKLEATKAEMLTLIGNAERVNGSNFTISAGIVGETPIAYTRKAYRTFKVTFKKTKD